MENIGQLKRMLTYEREIIKRTLASLQAELGKLSDVQKTIVIKEIRGRQYYYSQWLEGKKLRSRSLGLVRPGVIAELEQRIQQKAALEEQVQSHQLLLQNIEDMLKRVQKDLAKQKLMENYIFEVYWKDEITARVYVREHEVIVSRFTDHPLKQLFAEKRMTRFQLNQVLEMRCWDRNRPDIQELLAGIGLQEYRPQDIVRRTHGVSYNDYIWLRFPGEGITCRDVLVRR